MRNSTLGKTKFNPQDLEQQLIKAQEYDFLDVSVSHQELTSEHEAVKVTAKLTLPPKGFSFKT